MLKKFGLALAAALVSLFGAVAVAQQPAQASTVHNCPDADLCLFWDSGYSGSQTNQTLVAIMHASGQCWQLNSTWSNRTSSWYANFSVYNGQTVQRYFYDNTTCSGSNMYEGQAPQGQSSMGIYNDWTGSIKLVLA